VHIIQTIIKLKIIIDFFNNYIDLIQSKQLPIFIDFFDIGHSLTSPLSSMLLLIEIDTNRVTLTYN
jgi:hypothetical protein